MPKPVIWGGLILGGLLLAHPTSRKTILKVGAGLFEGGAIASESAFGMLLPMFEEHLAAQGRARLNLAKAQSALGPGPSAPASPATSKRTLT